MSATDIVIGGHVDRDDPIGQAVEAGFPIAQTFLGDPQGWKAPTVSHPGGFAGLREDAEAAGVGLYIHAPYIINVATSNNRIRIPSRKVLQQQLNAAAEVGARGVIVHGGHVLKDDDSTVGVTNWRKCIEGLDIPVPLLIENTAGGANAMARHLDRLAAVWAAIQDASGAEMVGFCLDTCHAHAAGNPLSSIVDDVLEITGRIDLVHLNDSRDAFGSGADRHATLGEGHIDPDDLVRVAASAGAPLILETPGGLASQKSDAQWLRERLT